MQEMSKPTPHVDRWTSPFWDACKENRLIMQKCRSTGKLWFPPGPVSPFTRNSEWNWAPLSGSGRVGSFIIMHQAYFEGFLEELPYPIAQIELEEGPMMISNLIGIPLEQIKVSMPVRVTFVPGPENWRIPVFAPTEAV